MCLCPKRLRPRRVPGLLGDQGMAFFDDDLPGGSGYLDASSVFLDAVPGSLAF